MARCMGKAVALRLENAVAAEGQKEPRNREKQPGEIADPGLPIGAGLRYHGDDHRAEPVPGDDEHQRRDDAVGDPLRRQPPGDARLAPSKRVADQRAHRRAQADADRHEDVECLEAEREPRLRVCGEEPREPYIDDVI